MQNGAEVALTDRRWALIFVNLVVSGIASSILSTAMTTALPNVVASFDVSTAVGQWVTSGYSLATGMVMPLTAFLITRFPTKRLYIAGNASSYGLQVRVATSGNGDKCIPEQGKSAAGACPEHAPAAVASVPDMSSQAGCLSLAVHWREGRQGRCHAGKGTLARGLRGGRASRRGALCAERPALQGPARPRGAQRDGVPALSGGGRGHGGPHGGAAPARHPARGTRTRPLRRALRGGDGRARRGGAGAFDGGPRAHGGRERLPAQQLRDRGHSPRGARVLPRAGGRAALGRHRRHHLRLRPALRRGRLGAELLARVAPGARGVLLLGRGEQLHEPPLGLRPGRGRGREGTRVGRGYARGGAPRRGRPARRGGRARGDGVRICGLRALHLLLRVCAARARRGPDERVLCREPFVGVVLSWALFREAPGPAFLAALALMALGTWLATPRDQSLSSEGL